MAWITLGIIDVINTWFFSTEIEGETFRITHLSPNFPNRNLRAVVAQGFLDERAEPNIFNPKIILRREESEIFSLYFPLGLAAHSFGIKRLDNLDINWQIKVELWNSESKTDEFANYLIARFGPVIQEELLVSLYPRGGYEEKSLALEPSSDKKRLKAGQPKKLLSGNNIRRKLTVRTGMSGITLATGFNADGEPLEVIENVPPNFNFDLPGTADAIYQGEVWAFSYMNTFVEYTEYSLVEAGEDKKAPPKDTPSEDTPEEEASSEDTPEQEVSSEDTPEEEPSV